MLANEFASPRAVASCARWLRVALRGGDAAKSGDSNVGPSSSLPPPLLFDSPDAGALLAVLADADGRLLRRLLRRLRQSTDGGDAAAGGDAEQKPVEEVFLTSCADEFHVPKELLFQPDDLRPGSGADGVDRVVRCLHALSRTHAAAAAGFQELGADNIVYTDSGFADGGISCGGGGGGGARAAGNWDAPVLGVIDQLVGFFRACRVLARELRESPLSLWPPGAVEDVFGPTAGLLALLLDLRAALRSGQPLDEALAEREVQLIWLYAGQNWHMHLTGRPTLDAIISADGRCAIQVKSALAKLPHACEAKEAQDLLLMPGDHHRQLTQAAGRALSVARRGPRIEEAAVARLERACNVLCRVDKTLSNRSEYTKNKVKPSCEAFIGLKWPQQLQPPPRVESLGRLQHRGSLYGPDGKRARAFLWDRALVLASPESDEVLERVDITQGLKFVEVNGSQSIVSIRSRRWSFNVTEPDLGVSRGAPAMPQTTAPTPPPKPRSFACDSASDRKAWLEALDKARRYSFPEGFDRHRHCFRRVAVALDGAPAECRQCGQLLKCWAHRCDLCQFSLHRNCVTVGCGGDGGDHLSCRPVPTPRKRSRPSITSLQQQRQQQQQERQHSWCLTEPLDAEAAKPRLQQLRRQSGRCRNFLLCPSASSSTSLSDGYQLHVLSDDTVTSYDVETVEASTGEAQRLRIAESDESFSSLAELALHYSKSLLPEVDCQEEDEYSSVPENLVFDDRELEELTAQFAGL